MYHTSLINAVQVWQRRLEIENQQQNHVKERLGQPAHKKISTGVKPVAESEGTMYHTSLINAVQVWQRRLEIEEEQRKQRMSKANNVHETFMKRLPRLKIQRIKKLNHQTEIISSCNAQVDCQDALHS